jgi:hypothetical protein
MSTTPTPAHTRRGSTVSASWIICVIVMIPTTVPRSPSTAAIAPQKRIAWSPRPASAIRERSPPARRIAVRAESQRIPAAVASRGHIISPPSASVCSGCRKPRTQLQAGAGLEPPIANSLTSAAPAMNPPM